jgi:hypothetical protein
MTKTVTLYIGSTHEADCTAETVLRRWTEGQRGISLVCESIHANPAAAVRLGITSLPALVVSGKIVAQGPPDGWLDDDLLDTLAARLGTGQA